jgi:hypothetical protein
MGTVTLGWSCLFLHQLIVQNLLYTAGCISLGAAACLKGLTVGRPANARTRNRGPILVNLEPNGAPAVESSSRAGCPGEVNVDRARVGKGRVGVERDAGSGRDSQGLGRSRTGAKLVACHLRRGDVGHRAVGVMVLGAARVLPVGAGNTAR